MVLLMYLREVWDYFQDSGIYKSAWPIRDSNFDIRDSIRIGLQSDTVESRNDIILHIALSVDYSLAAATL